MDRATIEPAIKIVLSEIHSKLSEATRIANSLRKICARFSTRHGKKPVQEANAYGIGISAYSRSLWTEN
jgi:hypothetical protein